MTVAVFVNLAYIVAIVFFILGLKMLTSPITARKGNFLSAGGMFLAVVVTLLYEGIIDYRLIIVGVAAGSIIGAFAARMVKMTQVPEMIALFNGFGGLASLLVGWGTYHTMPTFDLYVISTISFAVLVGGITFSGSLIAWSKLSGIIGGRPIFFPGQKVINSGLMLVTLLAGTFVIMQGVPTGYPFFIGFIGLALTMGILSVIPIGGADMPVVISLLNSYSGIAACTAGLAIQNNILIVSGALVGASGIILTKAMCRAMNRSLVNVLFGGFGAITVAGDFEAEGEVNPISAEDAYYILEAANSVVFVPGYGMAVAQAQYVLHELGGLLETNGCDVRYAIHPVAGRMPGHMNVLLAEADVPYEKLVEMDDINRTIAAVDVCVVVGANDVVNPAAREAKTSPIYGMPIINADQAKMVIVLKRSMSPGFAGIDNHLFFKENTRMLFGDAKDSIETIISEWTCRT
jgi:NAD(P) transhydrogenase subunit beta